MYYPTRIAARVNGCDVTYSELASRALAVASTISEQSANKNKLERCAVIAKSKLEFLIAAYGAMFARCSLIVVNPKLTEGDLAQLLTDNEAEHLVCDDGTKSIVEAVTRRVKDLRSPIVLSTVGTKNTNPESLQRWKLASSQGNLYDEWGLVFSSGSTGVPKAIVQSHLGVISESLAWHLELELRRDSRFFVARPLFYTGGLALTLACHTTGAMVVVADGDDNDPGSTLSGLAAAAKLGHIDWVFFVPEQARSILRHQTRWDFPGNPASVLIMGSKTSGDEKQSLANFFGAAVVESWGNSEGLGTITDREDLARRPSSIGRSFIGEHVLVVNDENCEALAARAVGRLAGTESTMFTEYAGAPDVTASTKRAGLVLSADLGYQDDDGYLYILGRTDDVARLTNGDWVTVDAVERRVMSMAHITEVAAIVVKENEQIKIGLMVILESSSDAEEQVSAIEASVRSLFPDPAIICKTLVVQQIPRLATGKTDRVTIRRTLGWN